MRYHLPGGFQIGQWVQYHHWFLSSRRNEVDIVTPGERTRTGISHTGFIAGHVTIEDDFYYIVLCDSKIELVIPEDLTLQR